MVDLNTIKHQRSDNNIIYYCLTVDALLYCNRVPSEL